MSTFTAPSKPDNLPSHPTGLNKLPADNSTKTPAGPQPNQPSYSAPTLAHGGSVSQPAKDSSTQEHITSTSASFTQASPKISR